MRIICQLSAFVLLGLVGYTMLTINHDLILPLLNSLGQPIFNSIKTGNVEAVAEQYAAMEKRGVYDFSTGLTPLLTAIQWGRVEVIQSLITSGADVDEPKTDGRWPPMHMAASKGRIDIMEMLVKAGAQIHARDSRGYSALHCAAMGIDQQATVYLLAAGLQVDAVDSLGRTPLHYAADFGNHAIAEALIGHGASINIKDKEGCTPWHFAARVKSIGLGIFGNSGQEFNLDDTDNYGRTPLHYAALSGNPGPMKSFIENDADLNIKDKNQRTPLHYAARVGIAGVKLLLKAGRTLDINARDEDGCTALQYAAHRGHVKAIQMLIEHGADVTIMDNSGGGLLHHAVHGNVRSIQYLLSPELNLAVDVNAKDNNGCTPFYIAFKTGRKSIIACLLDHINGTEKTFQNMSDTADLAMVYAKDVWNKRFNTMAIMLLGSVTAYAGGLSVLNLCRSLLSSRND